MADTLYSGHYIPLSRPQLYEALREDGGLEGEDRQRFDAFCDLLQSAYHHDFHDAQLAFKRAYRPFNPDLPPQVPEPEPPDLDALESELIARLEKILAHANFQPISQAQIERALESEGLFPISLSVGFDDFVYSKLYYIGESDAEQQVKGWIPFTKKWRHFRVFDRVVVIFKLKSAEHFEEKGVKDLPGRPGKIYVKYLRFVPQADLEMVYPNTKPRMKLIHRLKIGVPLLVGIPLTLHKLVVAPFILGSGPNPFSSGLSLTVIVILVGLFGYVFKTYTEYKSTVHEFVAEIASSLYFKNLVSNQGVFTTLVEDAEEQETKEAVIAYYFLLAARSGLTEPALDKRVEVWFREKHGVELDFEVDDALEKLRALGLATVDADGVWSPLPLERALARLDYLWDNHFHYPEPESPGEAAAAPVGPTPSETPADPPPAAREKAREPSPAAR